MTLELEKLFINVARILYRKNKSASQWNT